MVKSKDDNVKKSVSTPMFPIPLGVFREFAEAVFVGEVSSADQK